MIPLVIATDMSQGKTFQKASQLMKKKLKRYHDAGEVNPKGITTDRNITKRHRERGRAAHRHVMLIGTVSLGLLGI